MSIEALAKELRKHSTDAERYLWQHLRGRKILNAKFRRQHATHPYIVDFVCLENKLIIEVDGSQHSDQQINDSNRTTFLESQGFRVLRFWNNEVLTQIDSVLEVIHRELEKQPLPLPSPQPSPKGRGSK